MSKKDWLATAMVSSGYIAVKRLFSKPENRVTILAYHRIIPIVADFPFDKELISATPEQFEWQVQYLRKYFNIISFSDLKERLQQGLSPLQNSLIITFDDGFDDNYFYAFTILKKYGVKASFFVSTDYIGTETPFWFDRVVFLSRFITKDIVLTAEYSGQQLQLTANASAETQNFKLLKFLKAIPDSDRNQVINQLERCVDAVEMPTELSKPISWPQLDEMQKSGLAEIGSHTKSHRILSQVDSVELHSEIALSRELIVKNLGCECVALTYPVGGASAINDRVLEATEAAGYSFAATYISGINVVENINEFTLKRLHVERYTTRKRFMSMLEHPALIG